jgi:hypothetical protein
MKRLLAAILLLGGAAASQAGMAAPIIEITGPDGRIFREIPVRARDGAMRSYLEAERGARYEVRVRNTSGERLGLVIAVDGRNIIDGRKSELARSEPMYVLGAWDTQNYAGWRANLDAINEFYFTDWSDSYAEAFGDRSAKGVIAVAVYREVPPPPPVAQRYEEEDASASRPAGAAGAPPAADRAAEKSAGTGYGDRRADRAVVVEFVAESDPATRHFIKYEWRETLCRKQLLDCGEKNRFWDESVLGFAPPPPRRR